MSFFSTRGGACVTASQSILWGLAADGGLYVPSLFPQISSERLAARCWDLGDRGRLSEIAGKNLREPPAPRDIMIYFAWYSHKGIPYFEAMKGKQPLLF